MSEQTSAGSPMATAVLQEHSASVTAFGQTRECSALDRDTLETQVMDLLLSAARYSPTGEVQVELEGDEAAAFILSTNGDTRPVPVPPPTPAATEPPSGQGGNPWVAATAVPEAAAQAPELQHVPGPEPASWGLRGWLNRLFKLNVKASADEREHRRRAAELSRQDADNRQRLLRETTRTLGYCGYLTVMSEKGGIGKTTISCLLAWFIAEVRQQSVVVADLNPDKGSLAPRIGVRPDLSIRDLVRSSGAILAYDKHVNQFLAKVPHANVSVLGGDTDPKRRETTSASDVETVAQVFRPFFQVGILDNGTGITHSALQGSLNVSHGAVIVVDNTEGIDDFVNSTLDHLQANEYADLRDRVVLVVIESTLAPPPPSVDRRDRDAWQRAMRQHEQVMAAHVTGEAIAAKFQGKVRDVVIFPYDPALAGGGTSTIRFEHLTDDTRRAARQLAGSLIDDLVN